MSPLADIHWPQLSLIKTKPFDFVISEHSKIGVNGVQVLNTAKQRELEYPGPSHGRVV